ncbi:hypothetical protein [Ralstonia phage RP31]|uniref:Uncharacterized protein n=1 Tax=Ralstonia phage RP31 TaxID=1923890 RepID=A0A1L7N1X5_9CAUD|nr:hypothetical protein [Ralstonia phage RP31]
MAVTTLRNIATAISDMLEDVLDFKPQLEVMATMDQKIVFREDWTYYANVEGAIQPFNPFVELTTPGEVHCMERPALHYTAAHLNHAWAAGSFDYFYMPNPQFFQLVADFLNVYLNEDQLWSKLHPKPTQHFLQFHLSLEKLVAVKVPELAEELLHLQTEIGSEQSSFRHQVFREGMTREDALKLYDVSGSHYENVITQDFWDRHQIQYVLNELTVKLARIVNAQFPAIRPLAERSVQPQHGYDVFCATVLNDNQVSVSSLGDYRILHWEINQ